MQAESSF